MSLTPNGTNENEGGFIDRVLDFFAYIAVSVSRFFTNLFNGKRTSTPSEGLSERKSLGKVQRTGSVVADSTRKPGIIDAHRSHRSASASRSISTKHTGRRIFSSAGEQQFKKIFTISAFSVVVVVAIVLLVAAVTPSGGPIATDASTVVTGSTSSDVDVSQTDCVATLTFGGAIHLQDEILTAAQNSDGYDFNNYLSELTPIFTSDINMVTLDGTVSTDGIVTGYPYANYPIELAETLNRIGVNYVSTAASGALATGFTGMTSTLDNLEANGITAIGTYRDETAAKSVYVTEVNHIKIGIGTYNVQNSDNYSKLLSEQSAAGVSSDKQVYAVNQLKMSDASAAILADVKAMKAAGAEIIVINVNWAYASSKSHTDDKRNVLAQDLIDAGVDIVIGTGPDYVQKITKKAPSGSEEYSYVFYSLGNLFADADSGSTSAKYQSMAVTFTIERKSGDSEASITSVVCHPIYIHRDGQYSESNTYLKYRVVPAVKYYSVPERPDFFASDSQWKACKSAFDSIYKTVSATAGINIGTYDSLFGEVTEEQSDTTGYSGRV